MNPEIISDLFQIKVAFYYIKVSIIYMHLLFVPGES